MARSDWYMVARGHWKRDDNGALVLYRCRQWFMLAPEWVCGELFWKWCEQTDFTSRQEAMDYADTHYPMEPKP